jgi:glycosyltransferase involved in cell wall biosynthesis
VRIAFLVNDLHLSGGINVVVKHAAGLRRDHGHDVFVVVALPRSIQEWHYPELGELNVIPLADVSELTFDLVIATWWETVFNLGLIKADRAIWFMQSMEDRFYAFGDPMQLLAQTAFAIDIPIVTEASWIARQIHEFDAGRLVGYAPNGIDKSVFRRHAKEESDEEQVPFRILIEGSQHAPNKGVDQSFDVVELMKSEVEVTWISSQGARCDERPNVRVIGPLTFEEMSREYSRADVLLKLSRVEGMFGPPLEAFHGGATAVVTPVSGAEEYIISGVNAEVVAWDDVTGTAALLDSLARDRERLANLKAGALKTASQWPDWKDSTARFESELRRICTELSQPNLPRVRAQASVLRLVRVQSRLNHGNSIETLKFAVESVEKIQKLENQLAVLQSELVSRNESRIEREWWLAFRERRSVRILLVLRRRYRTICGRTRRRLRRLD